MSVTSSYPHLDPQKITIHRDSRQRQENINDIEDLKASIKSVGIINPIIVRMEGDETILVAGERRLKASLELGLPLVPIRNFNDLSPLEAEIIELEENVKRKELYWKDQVRSIGRIHLLYRKQNNGWKIEQTAEAVSLGTVQLRKILHVFDALDTGRIAKAEGIEQAYNTLHRFSERKAESIVGDLIVKGAQIFGQVLKNAGAAVENAAVETFTTTSAVAIANEELLETPEKVNETPRETVVAQAIIARPQDGPVICANFIEWAKGYTGPKFTLVHCDFPYGNYRGGDSQGSLAALETEDFYDNYEKIYWDLLEALTSNLDKIMSYSAHLVFWFNMNFYTETVSRLRKTGLMVHDHPLVWHKTTGGGGLGVNPGSAGTHPRRTYDTALLGVRGNRPLVRSMCNSYAAPTVGNKIHPSQKPEPMLRYFLQMFVDETTSLLDPTCGSAAALRAAEDLGAKSVLGIEMDVNYAQSANTRTLQARVLRQAGTLRKEEV